MFDLSKYSCDKCKKNGSWLCKHCWHTAGKKPTRFKPKKKTGCETPELRKYTSPPPPPTSGSNAVKPNPNYVPPASAHRYNPPPMPPIKPAKKEEEITFNRVQLYCTIDDLNAYIHKALGDKHKNDVYVPIGATINSQNLNLEIDFMSINPEEDDYCRRIRLEVKL